MGGGVPKLGVFREDNLGPRLKALPRVQGVEYGRLRSSQSRSTAAWPSETGLILRLWVSV